MGVEVRRGCGMPTGLRHVSYQQNRYEYLALKQLIYEWQLLLKNPWFPMSLKE